MSEYSPVATRYADIFTFLLLFLWIFFGIAMACYRFCPLITRQMHGEWSWMLELGLGLFLGAWVAGTYGCE